MVLSGIKMPRETGEMRTRPRLLRWMGGCGGALVRSCLQAGVNRCMTYI